MDYYQTLKLRVGVLRHDQVCEAVRVCNSQHTYNADTLFHRASMHPAFSPRDVGGPTAYVTLMPLLFGHLHIGALVEHIDLELQQLGLAKLTLPDGTAPPYWDHKSWFKAGRLYSAIGSSQRDYTWRQYLLLGCYCLSTGLGHMQDCYWNAARDRLNAQPVESLVLPPREYDGVLERVNL
jgi:hypothetical protein